MRPRSQYRVYTMEPTINAINEIFDANNVLVSLFEKADPDYRPGCSDKEKFAEYNRVIKHPTEIRLSDFITLGSKYIPSLERLWNESDKGKRRDLKSTTLPCATISCTLRSREKKLSLEEKMKTYTGIVVMDFDDVQDKEDIKEKLIALPYVWYAGLSCSKRGVFALVPTDNKDYTKHRLYCLALSAEMKKLGLQLDKKCFYVNCPRFISFDEHPKYNHQCHYYSPPAGLNFDELEEEFAPEATARRKDGKCRKPADRQTAEAAASVMPDVTMDKVNAYCNEWVKKRVPLDDYGDWMKIGMALSKLGLTGWELFDEISVFSPKYNLENNRKIWDEIKPETVKLNIGTFFYMCHRYGVMPDTQRIYDDIPYPVEVFPEDIRKIIGETNRCLNFSREHIASSLLFTAGAAIGNSMVLNFKNSWNEKAILYMALVGKPGTNKSAPLKFAMKPLQQIDSKEKKKYAQAYAKYDEAMRKANRMRMDLPETPQFNQTIMIDFTTEVLIRQHIINPRGLAVYVDELYGFVRNFNKYRNGSDEQMWNELFNGGTMVVNRMNSQPLVVEDSFIGIIGTIQPGVLPDFSRGKQDTGFMDRWLFSYPSETQCPLLNMDDLDQTIPQRWCEIVQRIHSLPMNDEPRRVRMTDDAAKIYTDWTNSIRRLRSKDSMSMAGAMAKFERYCMRFAIILEAMKYGCGQQTIEAVTADSVKGAIDLCTYYLSCAFRVRRFFKRDPLDGMTEIQKSIYNELPITFRTSEGIAIADSLGMKERTFKEWIKSEYFKHVCHGQYERRYT